MNIEQYPLSGKCAVGWLLTETREVGHSLTIITIVITNIITDLTAIDIWEMSTSIIPRFRDTKHLGKDHRAHLDDNARNSSILALELFNKKGAREHESLKK